MDTGSEDEGPEDVLLVEGKDEALNQKRLEAAAVKRVKLSIKEKRRLKAEMFKKQKEAKQLRTLTTFPEGDLDKALCIMADRETARKGKRARKRVRSAAAKKKPMPTVVQVGSVRVVAVSCGETKGRRRRQRGVGKEGNQSGGHVLSASVDRYPRKKNLNRPAVNFCESKQS